MTLRLFDKVYKKYACSTRNLAFYNILHPKQRNLITMTKYFNCAVFSYSVQELLELAQRKFVRQLASYCLESEEALHMPRLFILDFLRAEEKQKLREKELAEIREAREKKRKEAAAAELASLKDRQKRLADRRKRLEMYEGADSNPGRARKKRSKDEDSDSKVSFDSCVKIDYDSIK